MFRFDNGNENKIWKASQIITDGGKVYKDANGSYFYFLANDPDKPTANLTELNPAEVKEAHETFDRVWHI